MHKLRTQTRRLESILNSFMLEQEPEMKRLLKVMTPVRKAAAVRDNPAIVLGFPCIQIISEHRT